MSSIHSNNFKVQYDSRGREPRGRRKQHQRERPIRVQNDPFFDHDEEDPIYDDDEKLENLISTTEDLAEREVDERELGGEG